MKFKTILNWLYSYFNPSTVHNMKPQNFFIITRKGALGLGEFPFHDWHKCARALSYKKIAEQLHRSSRTPLLHIQRHNRNVERTGFCPICKKMKSGFEIVLPDKG